MSTAYTKWKKSSKLRKTADRNVNELEVLSTPIVLAQAVQTLIWETNSAPTFSTLSDVKLSDFADSGLPPGKGRLKKANCSLTRGVKEKEVKQEWDENLAVEEEEDEKGVTFDNSVVTKQREKELNKKNLSLSNDCKKEERNNENGLNYPIDIWFHLSEYILPEDVKKFSLICRSSYYVVNTPKFWINLYKRHYCKMEMPKSLLPHCLEIHHGLKTSVIQALFYMYRPFSTLAQTSMYLTDFDSLKKLVGKRCILMWIERVTCNDGCDKWIYKFKFKRNEYGIYQGKSAFNSNKFRIKADVNANPEEGCQILNIPSQEFVALPCINGSKLKNITGRMMRLNFVFSTSPVSYSTSDDVNVVLRPCVKPSLLDWWHPMYNSHGDDSQMK